MDNRDTIRVFNSLKEGFPEIEDIFSTESELSGSLETFIFKEGGEVQFYLTAEDQEIYIPKVISYYALSQIMHIFDQFDKSDHNMDIDRSTKLIEVEDNGFYLKELIPTRGAKDTEAWEPIWDIIKVLKSNLESLNYAYLGYIPRT